MEQKVLGNKIPFEPDLFFFAMVGFVGRQPNSKHGHDGFYHWTYIPEDRAEAQILQEKASKLAQWLDLFDITFSGSSCQFGKSDTSSYKGEVLELRISYPAGESQK